MSKKIFIIIAFALTFMLFHFNGRNTLVTVVMAEEVMLEPWIIYQAGDYSSEENMNISVFDSFTTSQEETLNNKKHQEMTFNTIKNADGYVADIRLMYSNNNSQSNVINPERLKTYIKGIRITPGHEYVISFKAKASSEKYVYIMSNDELGVELYDFDYDESKVAGFEIIPTYEKEFTYKFTNWTSSKTFDFVLMFGPFIGSIDFDGINIENKMTHGQESNWSGRITVSEFKVIDKGMRGTGPCIIPTPPQVDSTLSEDITTWNKTVEIQTSSIRQENVGNTSIKKIKNRKNKKILITLKKVTGVTGYQIVYSTKSSLKKGKKIKISKVKYTIKKLKKGKKYYFKARTYKKINGKIYYGKWSKVKKVKIKR